MLSNLRDLTERLDPLALLRAAVAAWPFVLAIVVDWPFVQWWMKRKPVSRGRSKPRWVVRSAFWLTLLMNAAAAGASMLAAWCAARLLNWLPRQVSDFWLVRVIADRRVRAWEALLVLILVSGCAVLAKAVTLRGLAGCKLSVGVWVWLAVCWSVWLGLIWGIDWGIAAARGR